MSLAFSPDSKLVALPVDTLKIALWNVESGRIERDFDGKQSGSISAVGFSPNGRLLAVAASDYSLVIWDTVAGRDLHQLPSKHIIRFPGRMNSLAFSPDGHRLVFGEDHCLRLWDLDAWREVQPLQGHANPIYRTQFCLDNKTLVTAADETADALQEWDTATGKKLRTLWRQSLMGRNGYHLSPNHRVLTTADIDVEKKGLRLRSLNTATGNEIRRVTLSFDQQGGYSPGMIVLSPDGKIITSEARENGALGPLRLRDTITGKDISNLSGDFHQLVFSPDSAMLAYVELDRIGLYSVSQGRTVSKQTLASSASGMAFSLDSRLLAVAYSDAADLRLQRIDLWETTMGRKRAALIAARIERASALAFSPDGALLAAGDSEGVLHLWSLATGKEIRQLQGHRGRIESLGFSHDGKLLASGSGDTTALVWDVREAAEAARPQATEVPREQLAKLWADLADDDGIRVQKAIWRLVAARQAVPWLREHLKPIRPADARRITQLIADLDSANFAVREKATRELEQMGESAEPDLRKVLESKPSLELRRRVEPLVNNLENWPTYSPAALRDWRALEVLEHLGTPEARRLLQQLADGVAQARLTRQAKAALQRLAERRTR